ncbi:MAG TPA: hypothetical protein VM890_01560 [Longimicrobium sp.]|jgi:hypothetical protein|nr:hypothetical protein [Longimicrobium sp.]
MISVIHSPPEAVTEDDFYQIPAGGRRMEMDWERVTAAFQSAVARLGWDADLEIRPEKQYVMVRFRGGAPAAIAAATSEFYCDLEESIGAETFMSIWIDYSFKR